MAASVRKRLSWRLLVSSATRSSFTCWRKVGALMRDSSYSCPSRRLPVMASSFTLEEVLSEPSLHEQLLYYEEFFFFFHVSIAEHPDEAEVSAHISSGVLHLRVSCGAQNMAFVDPRLRVDDGNLQTIELELKSYDQSDGVETSGKCAATVRLNETHEMRGEQESEPAVAPLAPSVIYLGQMLSGGRNGIRNVGFRGCITHFQVVTH